jgi:hypothetical protein
MSSKLYVTGKVLFVVLGTYLETACFGPGLEAADEFTSPP